MVNLEKAKEVARWISAFIPCARSECLSKIKFSDTLGSATFQCLQDFPKGGRGGVLGYSDIY